MPAQTPSGDTEAPKSLATAGLPPRVRKLLEHALALVTEEIDIPMGGMLNEFEQELFRLADQARNPGTESGYIHTLRGFRLNRADLVPHFILALEAGLAAIRSPAATAAPAAAADHRHTGFGKLSLVDESVMDEGTVLREIASRQEGRANLPLHLLGQRFGVLAAAPAYDAERLPLGPQALCRALRTAALALEIEHDSRLLLYRIFDRQVMAHYARVLDKLDQLLDREGVLSGLTYVPLRLRPSPVPGGERPKKAGASQADAGGAEPANAHDAEDDRHGTGAAAAGDRTHAVPSPPHDPQRPYTAWMGEGAEELDEDEQQASEKLQQLLANRRELLGKLRPGAKTPAAGRIDTQDVFDVLGHLQSQPLSVAGAPQTLADVKQTILAQARQRRGAQTELSPRDNDVFELLSMLFGNLEGEMRMDSPAAALVRRLQVPLLRVALRDDAFFVRNRHPARQLLNTIAENAAHWLDDSDFDPQFLAPMQTAVSQVVEKYDGNAEVFAASNEQLQTHLQAQIRKAELLERRHAEAARGKERLEVAKMRAADTLNDIVGDRRLPKFTRALLNQSWVDVLTLTLLRQGEESDGWRRQVDSTREIVEACSHEAAERDPELVAHIESALSQVGYHAEEASVIAQRLTSNKPDEEGDDDTATRTELAMKLKARARLGEDSARKKPQPPPRTAEEQAYHDQLKVLPFGTWIEFVVNQQGDVLRRRLSWFSPVTDNALFVNRRGQRVAEQSLDSVARMMAAGQARIVTAEHARLVDRAWQTAVHALRSFAGLGNRPDAEGARA